jgi:hypothetical protein
MCPFIYLNSGQGTDRNYRDHLKAEVGVPDGRPDPARPAVISRRLLVCGHLVAFLWASQELPFGNFH